MSLSIPLSSFTTECILANVPRIWSETIDAHRAAVREATLDATAALVAEHGLAGVTMSQIAKDTGIGRATLYKYFPDVESILRAWHERQVDEHLKRLRVVRDQAEPERLQAALIENMVREDLNPVEEAKACAALVEDLGLTKEELARRVGRSRPAISNLIRLLELPDETLESLEKGDLSEGHGRALLGAPGNDTRRRLARDAVSGGWSVRETEQRVRLAGQPRARPRKAPIDPDQRAALRPVRNSVDQG